jgi:PmbA protein
MNGMTSQRTDVMVADGSDLLALVELALAEARTLGASQAEAAVSMDVGLSVSVRMGEVETIEYQRDRGMGITVYFGTRKGAASTGDLSPLALRETVAKACSIARFTADDECAGLPDPDTLATEIPDLELAHEWDLAPEAACDLALVCEAAALAVDPRIKNSEGASVGTHRGTRAYGNSHGFLAAYPGPLHSVSCAVLGRRRTRWSATTGTARRVTGVSSSRQQAWDGMRRARRPPAGRTQARDDQGPRAVQPGRRARADRQLSRRDARRQPVPAVIVPAQRGGRARVSGVVCDLGAAASAPRARQRPVRPRRRRHP